MVPAAARGGPACRACVVSASEEAGGSGLASRSGRAQLLRRGRVSRIACACVVCLADELARKHAWVASLCLCSLTCMLMLVLCLLACCVCSSMWVSHSWAQQEEEGLARRKLVGKIMD